MSSTEKENVGLGILGAFLFALVGGVIWFILWQVGYLASISGLVGVICAVKGYGLLAKTKRVSVACIVSAAVSTIVVILLAWYLCAAFDLYKAFEGGIGFFDAVINLPTLFAENSEILIGYLKDLGLGLLFAVVGGGAVVSSIIKKQNQQDEAEARAEVENKQDD